VDTAQNNNKNNPNFRPENQVNGSSFARENGKIDSNRAIIPIEQYRKRTGDYDSSDELIIQRINFMEGLCRHAIKTELNNYVSKKNATKEENSIS
jgi:hypothetical protein